jgi:hypothetical protein
MAVSLSALSAGHSFTRQKYYFSASGSKQFYYPKTLNMCKKEKDPTI